MATAKEMAAMQRNEITIPAYSTATVDYNRTRPNYFSISNRGGGSVFASVSNMPTVKQYDIQVDKGSTKTLCEPYPRSYLYLYNPSGSEIRVSVLSWLGEFNPVVVALAGFEVAIDAGGITTNTNIDTFNASLPTGSNKIGKVEIDTPIPAGSNKIGSVDIAGAIPAGNNKIGIVEVFGKWSVYSAGTATTNTTILPAGQYGKIEFVTNDSTGDITVQFGANSVVLKAGETLQAVESNTVAVQVISGGNSFRWLSSVRG